LKQVVEHEQRRNRSALCEKAPFHTSTSFRLANLSLFSVGICETACRHQIPGHCDHRPPSLHCSYIDNFAVQLARRRSCTPAKLEGDRAPRGRSAPEDADAPVACPPPPPAPSRPSLRSHAPASRCSSVAVTGPAGGLALPSPQSPPPPMISRSAMAHCVQIFICIHHHAWCKEQDMAT
jgi:hypothetical protein